MIRNRLGYWYNLFYGNYEDLINLISNWDPDAKDDWDNLGRYWFNYLSSENAFRSKVMHWRKHLVELGVCSEEEYNKRLKQTDVTRYNRIIQDIRKSLHHGTTDEEWGLDLKFGLKIKANIDSENLEKIKIKIETVKFNKITFTPENSELKGIISHHIVSQRIFLSWLNKVIDKYLDPEDRFGNYAIDVLDEFDIT